LRSDHGIALFVALLAACGGGGARNDDLAIVEGTATIAGAPAALTSCKAVGQYEPAHFVQIELGLATGQTVIVDPIMGMKLRVDGEVGPLDCSRLEVREEAWAATPRPWSQGRVGLTCATPAGELVLDARYDCGARDRPSNKR
jgi:hypothetical protein